MLTLRLRRLAAVLSHRSSQERETHMSILYIIGAIVVSNAIELAAWAAQLDVRP